MPNWCTTSIWLRCPDEKTAIAVETKINDLLSKQFIPNGFDSKDYFCWLGNIVGNAGFVDDSSTDDGLIYRCRGSVTFVGIDPAGDIENTNTVFIDTETAWVPMLRMWVAFLDKFFPGKEIRLEYVSSEPGCDLYWTNRPDFAGKYHVEYLDPEGNDTIFIDASSKTDVLKELTNHMIKQNPNALSKIKSLGGDINSIDTIYAELADSEYSGFEYSGFTEYLSVAKWEHVNPCECD